MKKIIYSIICSLMLFTLCGCISMTGDNAVTSVEFTQLPQKTILKTIDGNEAQLNAEIIVVQNTKVTKYSINVTKDGPEYNTNLADLVITVTGYKNMNKVGNYTLTITVEDFTLSHNFRVVDTEDELLFAGGNGKKLTPFEISNTQELCNIKEVLKRYNAVDGLYFKLINDINISGFNWEPIGTSTQKFNGTIDGDGHKIIGLTCFGDIKSEKITNITSGTTGNIFGFIGWAGENVTIKNLIFEDVKIDLLESGNGIGAVIAVIAYNNKNENSAQSIINIENVQVFGKISSQDKAGGLIGIAGYSTLNGCRVTFKDCENHINVNLVNNEKYTRGGGFIGQTDKSYLTFNNCDNFGDITAIGKRIKTSSYVTRAGAFVGHYNANEPYEVIFDENCSNSGTIKAIALSDLDPNKCIGYYVAVSNYEIDKDYKFINHVPNEQVKEYSINN